MTRMRSSPFVARSLVVTSVVALLAAAACGAADSGSDGAADQATYGAAGAGGVGAAGAAGTSAASKQATATIGPQGGVVEVAGATLTFAPGALPTMTSITLTATDEAAPDGFVALSKVFQCEPSGLDFPEGVTMRLTFQPDGMPVSVLWSSASNPSFVDVGGVVEGAQITAPIKHFSKGFAGRKL